MRRYDDPVEVRRGPVSGWGEGGDGLEGPEQFLWRGRLWKVRAVLAHWVETGPWWQSAGARAVVGSDEPTGVAAAGADRAAAPTELLPERELWRVEAGRGPSRTVRALDGALEPDGGGVFDLSFDWTDGRWQLVGCAD